MLLLKRRVGSLNSERSVLRAFCRCNPLVVCEILHNRTKLLRWPSALGPWPTFWLANATSAPRGVQAMVRDVGVSTDHGVAEAVHRNRPGGSRDP